jgi:hypothetical protein
LFSAKLYVSPMPEYVIDASYFSLHERTANRSFWGDRSSQTRKPSVTSRPSLTSSRNTRTSPLFQFFVLR